MRPRHCAGEPNWTSGRCKTWPGRPSGSTSRITAAANCSTACSMKICPGTPRHLSGSASALPDAARTAPCCRAHPRGRFHRARLRLAGSRSRPPPGSFGKDAYPTLDGKTAALLHSLARGHALIDGNKRLALAALIAFYGLNGRRLTLTNDAAYDLVINVASGQLDTADDIAAILQAATEPRN